jgi:hypothetical protein
MCAVCEWLPARRDRSKRRRVVSRSDEPDPSRFRDGMLTRSMVGRRQAIGLLAAALTGLVTHAPPPTRAGGPFLSVSDLRLAALGARLAAERPELARRLARRLGRRFGSHGAAHARLALLDPARIRGELARGATVTVDGWLLARSEAAVCVYLDRLRSSLGPDA